MTMNDLLDTFHGSAWRSSSLTVSPQCCSVLNVWQFDDFPEWVNIWEPSPTCCLLWFFCLFVFFLYWVWTQSLHLEPLHQPFFVMGFFSDRVLWTISPGWLQTAIFLISASWVARIIGMSHWCPAVVCFYKPSSIMVCAAWYIQVLRVQWEEKILKSWCY
jgi:hypothetical protein